MSSCHVFLLSTFCSPPSAVLLRRTGLLSPQGGFVRLCPAFRCWVLDVGYSVFTISILNTPPFPASIGGLWGRSGTTLDPPYTHRTFPKPRFQSGTLIQITFLRLVRSEAPFGFGCWVLGVFTTPAFLLPLPEGWLWAGPSARAKRAVAKEHDAVGPLVYKRAVPMFNPKPARTFRCENLDAHHWRQAIPDSEKPSALIARNHCVPGI